MRLAKHPQVSEIAGTHPSLHGQSHKTMSTSYELVVLRLAESETALRHLKLVWVEFQILPTTPSLFKLVCDIDGHTP